LEQNMLKHDSVWAAIDALAARNDISASALAKRAGLDPTTFNKSKRLSHDGRPRWPSTESLSKVLEATGASLDELFSLITGKSPEAAESKSLRPGRAPLMGFAQAGVGGYFDDAGFPAGEGWEQVDFPAAGGGNSYALQVSGDSMLPLYRNGDTIIVAPSAPVRRGDRVVARTKTGEVMAKVLERQGPDRVELRSVNPDHADRVIAASELDWMARIIWASQ
jgi:phage repressor protein C with HTH and peptisase S24 domain